MAHLGVVESVDEIVVEALARQYSFARHQNDHLEPDSEMVTRDIINAIADVLDREARVLDVSSMDGVGYRIVTKWLRSQAKDD